MPVNAMKNMIFLNIILPPGALSDMKIDMIDQNVPC
jgi:hypothetical protein